MKKLIAFVLLLLSVPVIVIFTIGIFILIITIQGMLFVPEDYLMWTFNYPASNLIFIYELFLLLGLFYLIRRRFKKDVRHKVSRTEDGFLKRNKKSVIALFIAGNVVLFYTVVSAVTVLTTDKIIDYSFLHPQGHEFAYEAIVRIDSGVYGKKRSFPFTHSKGDFFYIIELNNGKRIDLTEVGEVKGTEHEVFIIEDLDRKFVEMGIPKVSDPKNVEYAAEGLAEIYMDRIRSIIENTQ